MASGDLFGAASAEQPGTEGGKEAASGPASVPTFLAHCDGGARGNPGPAGYGAVITGERGNVVAELSEFLGNRTNNYAEYSGLLGVLAWVLEHGHRRLRVVSDSELMVKQIQGRYKVNSPDLQPLFDEARRRIGKLESFAISHALRHKNKDADRLANEAMDRGMGKSIAGPTTLATPAKTAGKPAAAGPSAAREAAQHAASSPTMLRGFVRGGTIHLLGGKTLPEGSFVKVIPE